MNRQLFEQVQERLQCQRLPEPKPSGGSAALLKGLLWCEACQAGMVLSQTSHDGRRYRYYVCSNAQRRNWKAFRGKPIRANVIEESVLDQVTMHCKLDKRRRQEHVGALLHRLLKRICYDAQNNGVTLKFNPAAPIQEEILRWPAGLRDPVSERRLRRLTQIPSWRKQLELWRQLIPAANGTGGKPVALDPA